MSGKGKRNGNGNGGGNGSGNGDPEPSSPAAPPNFRPGDLSDEVLLPKRFDRHVADTSANFELLFQKVKHINEKIDQLSDDLRSEIRVEVRSLRRAVSKLFAERDRATKGVKR